MPLVLGRTGLEQFGHAGQTAGNVAGLLALRSGYGPALRRGPRPAIAHLDQGAYREADGHRVVGAGILTSLPSVDQFDLRTHHLGEPRRLGSMTTMVDKPVTVHLLGHGQTFFHVFEICLTSEFGDDGRVSGSQLARIVPALMAGRP